MSLPSLGRGGIINSVRKLSGYDVPGWRAVDSTTEFIAGQVATLAANSTTGAPELTLCNGSSAKPVGIFFCHKATNFYKVVTNEVVLMPAIGSTANLKYSNLKSASYKVVYCNAAGTSTGATLTDTTNYSIAIVNGVLTNVNVSVVTPVYVAVSYLYNDTSVSGIDQTLGSGKAAYLSDPCEIATLVYDTASTSAYTLGGIAYVSTTGYISATAAGGSNYAIGTFTKLPTNEDPEVWVRVRIS
jgi:hypothetical protein